MLSFPKTCGICRKPLTTINETIEHRCEAIDASHHPDLAERLIEAHRTLQMSREYLYGLYPRGHRAADEISDVMVRLEAAIEAL